MKFLIKIIISSLAVMVAQWILPGVDVDDYFTGIAVALALAFLNAFVKPILVIFTIPATIFSFGLFLLVINALIILLADWIVPGFHVANFWWALIFSLLLSLITSVFEGINRKDNPDID
ncbi:MAG: hypothetical protein CL843_13165 [Crocinitomicaceae bacterium]|nr:hypothetical protein [Crocinitomicaceae bacterium]|tara:strand:+ start:130 stop:486 length:357 start_codon:yes stop_codon:yes gene_type:complete